MSKKRLCSICMGRTLYEIEGDVCEWCSENPDESMYVRLSRKSLYGPDRTIFLGRLTDFCKENGWQIYE